MIVHARRADPAPVQQVALPSSIVRLAVQQSREGNTAMGHAVSDLITLAFFFLLRVGEYTESTGERLTVPLRLQDTTLWQGNQPIPHTANDAEISQATGVTLKLANQKNGIKDAVMYHDSSGDPLFDPVKAAGRIVCRQKGRPRSSVIGTYLEPAGTPKRISPPIIREALKGATAAAALLGENINPHLVGTHSLRSGGAMRLKLAGYDELTIKKLGRWSSDTYLVYIQSQIGNLNAGIARQMAIPVSFRMIASPTHTG